MSYWIYIGIGAGAVLLLWLMIHLLRRRARRREMRQRAEDKLREEALDKLLIGRPSTGQTSGSVSSVPFDVRYDLDQRKKSEKQFQTMKDTVMVQLTERSELSTRKYMFHVSDRLTFGSKAPPCDIAVAGLRSGVCEIFRIDKSLYVRNPDLSCRIQLKRKRMQMLVEQNAVKLESRDVLMIGECTYEVSFVKN